MQNNRKNTRLRKLKTEVTEAAISPNTIRNSAVARRKRLLEIDS